MRRHFSLIHGVLLKPLPYRDPDRIVVVWEPSERARRVFGMNQIPVSPAMAATWKERSQCFEDIGFFRGMQANFGDAAGPGRLRGGRLTAAAFRAMGVQPILGRVFGDGEEEPGRDSVVVLGERLWRRRFAAARDIVGRTIRMDDKSVTVIGVMPESFAFPRGYELPGDMRTTEPSQFWRPLSISPQDRRNIGNHNMSVVARLKAGVSRAQAQAKVAAIQSHVDGEVEPAAAAEFGVSVADYHENLVGQSRPALLMLGGAVLMVLPIACIDVAGLLVVQALARGRERQPGAGG